VAAAAAIRVLLAPELETSLHAQMPGRIATLNASLGSWVRRGQVVVALDCAEPSARLKMAEAELASANETMDVKKRLRELSAAGDMEVAMAESMVARAQAQISLSRAQIDQCVVIAPFGGRIAKLHVKPHQGVGQGTPLVDVVSDGTPKLRLNVPSAWLRQLKMGTRFEVTIDEVAKTYPAKVSAINARVDAVAQTVEIEGVLDTRPKELLPGMSGTAHFAWR
jgi:RND family efflux transporter MFP subunit